MKPVMSERKMNKIRSSAVDYRDSDEYIPPLSLDGDMIQLHHTFLRKNCAFPAH
jgi:hypothetical protein